MFSKLVVLSAPSGAGKSTLAEKLLKKYANFKVSISYTTRPPRGNEQNGIHYFFISEAEFQEKIKANVFLEYAHVFKKYWYGTSKQTVTDLLAQNFNILFDIDVEGAKNIKKHFNQQCITVFILPPSLAELEKRLKNRKTDSAEAIATRLQTAQAEIAQAHDFDYQITNHDLEQAFSELEALLKKENCL